ncbi:4-hydroxy-3-methylbut-2-enyl diphosphate reductase [Clostridium sp. UBA7503]|uniref:4-hydroxy-3-methylbut-2-enyl diphosphate reductase n=1 Tax=Clostridium sp. UBA7503 TaxID=1946377 RepID=UPI0032162952
MKVHKSKYLNYCVGVNRAMEMAIDITEKTDDEVYMLGEIVHNPNASKIICDKGVKIVDDIDEIPNKSIIIIRAHGTTNETYKRAIEKELSVIDATCKMVQYNQQLVKVAESEGYTVVLIGDKNHDEVKSIMSYAENPIIVSSSEEVYENRDKLKKITVIIQTTEIIYNVKEIIAELALYCETMKFINTICYPCRNKQEEVIKMAQDNDAVLVIGSHASKNTMNLYLLAQKYNSKSFLVENRDMIDFNALKGVNTIGVVSGTSSPESVINEVIDCLEHNQVR